MPARLPDRIEGISLDFANTIYPLRAAETAATVRRLHAFLERRLGKPVPADTLHDLYVSIRERQFAENRATLRENDFPQRLREMIGHIDAPPSDDLVREASDAYGAGFIETVQLPVGNVAVIRRLSERYQGRVAVCSNFIRSDAIIEPLRRDALLPALRGVVVSCDVGFVKPHSLVFAAVCDCLGLAPHQVAHVGDDLEADIAGGNRFGFTTVYTDEWCEPQPGSSVAAAAPDFRVSAFSDLLSLASA